MNHGVLVQFRRMLIVDLTTNIARVAQQLQLDVVIDLALEFATRRHLTVPGDIGIGAPASASSASSEPAKQESKPSSPVPCAVPVGPSMIGQHITGQPFYEIQRLT